MNASENKDIGKIGDSKRLSWQSLNLKLQYKAKKMTNLQRIQDSQNSKDILEGKDDEQKDDAGYWNVMLCPLILVLCIVFVSPVILIPQHDGILFPECWYELMITTNLTFCVNWTLATFHDIKMILNMSSMVPKLSYIKMFLVLVLSFDIIYCFLYSVWTYGLNYNYPVPFASVVLYITSGIYFVSIWHLFPKELRRSKIESAKIKSFCILYLYCSFFSLQFSVMRKLFAKIPSKLQWIMAIVLPILRFLNEKVMYMLAKRSAGSDNFLAKANVSVTINVYYSMFIAITIGSIATPITSYCILGFDFMLNLYSCITIIRMHRKIDPQHPTAKHLEMQKLDEVTILALTEVVEVLAPILYMTTFLIAFHGPNALILGGIKNSYWNFNAVEDFGIVAGSVVTMFLFDVLFGLISSLLLSKFASLNMLKEYSKAFKKFWPVITLRFAAQSAKVN